ncbi:hypothetical protein Pnap_4594 (plasmid) [Polaromonas naphthalenivorans CJ2]|uniref:Transposase n=1 Tax=Polaromonas naphthalenivorans (strain CJ2) TaxID=365044 RepID=A1VW34_POLNA|nr:hypothetical protein Pnap_4594 [Polaromonas naphthalenivorans CJ2]
MLYQPSYSPDRWPFENCWAKRKTFLRAAKGPTREVLDTALKQPLDTVTAWDARGWFAHSGYPCSEGQTAAKHDSVRLAIDG